MIEYPKWALEIISNHYQVNFRTTKEHIEMFLLTEGGMYELQNYSENTEQTQKK